MNPLRLEQMTMFDIEPWEVIDLAEEMDIPWVSFHVLETMPGSRPVTTADLPRLIERLRTSSVKVDTGEAFALQHDNTGSEPGLAIAAELGARAVVAMDVLSRNSDEAGDMLAGFADLAGRYGLAVTLEPIVMARTRTPAEGLEVIRQSKTTAGLTLDLLHIVRTGTPVSALSSIPAERIMSAQLCDGPAHVAPEFAIEEAAFERGIPGTGVFPGLDFLRALPAGVPLGIETPLKSLREKGVPARERTRLVVEATRTMQRAALDHGA